jgi:AGZA family xanthine/uracil permease-like MFS transporter
LGVTPGVALAYAAMAAGLFAVEKFGRVSIAHPEPPLAVPAE